MYQNYKTVNQIRAATLWLPLLACMLTLAQIEPYLHNKPSKGVYHRYYEQSVRIASDIDAVFGVDYPKYLQVNRPKETKEVKAYRAKIYENVWTGFPERILQKLDKIQQSDDFLINYPTAQRLQQTLKDYCENEISTSRTLQDWFFQTFLRTFLLDPNAVMLVMPQAFENEKELAKPLPRLMHCNRVYGYREGKFAALLSEERTVIYDQDGKPCKGVSGNVWFFLDSESYTVARQTRLYPDEAGNWVVCYDILGLTQTDEGQPSFAPVLHYCKTMPVLKVGQLIEQTSEDGETLYKSVLSASVPFIKQAQARFNDLQIEFNHHVNSLEWLYDFFRCHNPECDNGQLKNGRNQPCPVCQGSGRRSLSSTETLIVSQMQGDFDKPGEYPPVPPGGVLQRSIEPAQKLIEYIDKLDSQAWQAIDMNGQSGVGLNQSGKAKELDREAENTKIRSVAMYLIRVAMQSCFEWISSQRYAQYYGTDYAAEIVPAITVPFNLNLLDASFVQQELKSAKENGMSAVLLGKLSQTYIEKSFGKTSQEMQVERAIQKHDRLYGYTVSEKAVIFGGGKHSPTMAISYEDYIISLNAFGFIGRAVEENATFFGQDYQAQRRVLVAYAQEVVKANPEPALYGQSNVGEQYGRGIDTI